MRITAKSVHRGSNKVEKGELFNSLGKVKRGKRGGERGGEIK